MPFSPTASSSPPTSPRSPTTALAKSLNPFRRSRSRPQLAPVLVPPHSSHSDEQQDREREYDCRPKSPSVILSPSTPDFPSVGLPPLPAPPPTELVAAQVLPPPSPTAALRNPLAAAVVEDSPVKRERETNKKRMDPTLRHSLALLDSRLAEIEQLGFGTAASVVGAARRASYQGVEGGGGVFDEEEERLADEEGGEEEQVDGRRNVRHSEPIMAPFSISTAAKDTSMTSLSSIATGTSSSEEDAFDIADFPSLHELGSSFDLGATPPSAAAPVSKRSRRSSDLMSFPVPPPMPIIPLRSPTAPTFSAAAAMDEEEERVFEQLAELGQRGSVQGLGLFSSTTTGTTAPSVGPSPLLSQNGRSSRSSSRSSRSSLSSKDFDASTLASSAANTSYGHREKEDHDAFPPELGSTLPLFAAAAGATPGSAPSSAAPSPLQHNFPAPLDPLTCNLTSAHPALASPFVEGSSFTTTLSSRQTAAASPALSQTNRTFAARSSSLLARVDGRTPSPASSNGRASPATEVYAPSNLLNELDEGDVPTWQVQEPEEVVQPERIQQHQHQHDHIRILESAQPPGPQAYGQLPPPTSAPGTFKGLKRLSSFGLLKKRKSEGVLGQSNAQNQQQSPSSSSHGFGSLTKRKSEAALSNLLRSSKGSSSRADKENSPGFDSPVQPAAGPNKLTRRSASSPKLSKLFSSPTTPAEPTPPLPTSPFSAATLPRSPTSTFSARPRALSFGESGEEQQQPSPATSKAKKRFSMYFNQLGGIVGGKDANGDVVPPLPPTPKEHLPSSSALAAMRSKAPAGMAIDVAKANELDLSPRSRRLMRAEQQSPAPTLEIVPTPVSAEGSLLFSPGASPAESDFTPISPSMSTFSRAAVPLYNNNKPLPSPFGAIDDALSPTTSDSFFPPSTPSSASAPAFAAEDPISLASFLKATDPDQQLIVKRPARTSSFFQPSSVFPTSTTSSSNGSRSRSRSSSRAAADRAETPNNNTNQNWSRPTSPALLDALKAVVSEKEQVFAPQEIIAFPVRVPQVGMPMPMRASPTAALGGGGGGGDEDDGESSGEDDYGSASEEDEDDDKPLGVVVPGALTAQKSLRLSAAKQRRSERKQREAEAQQKKDREMRELAARTAGLLRQQQQQQGRKEDPFELEQTAAMVATPPMSHDGHGGGEGGSRPAPKRPALSPIPSVGTYASSSTITSLQSMGHDSLLPQTDASVERKAIASTGLKRSPSSPLDPMIANSALTIDSPLLAQEPLPVKPTPTPPVMGRKRSGTVTRIPTSSSPPQLSPGAAPPMPTMRPPPAPPVVPSGAAPPSLNRRPSLHPHSSNSSPASSPASTPLLSRRPSLHPDLQPAGMVRQASSSSNKSGASSSAATAPPLARTGTLSRSNTLARARSNTTSSAPPVEIRVYLDAEFSQHLTVQYTERTLAGEIVAFGKGKGALGKPATPKEALEGGWALFEVWRGMGIERPLREYELVADVVKTWDSESAVLVFRRTPLWPILSSHARLHPTMPRTGPVQLEVKKGKWSKRFLELKDGAISYSKSEKGKDSTTLCQLSNFDVFFVSPQTAEQLKAPKPFVFALKSRLTRAHFEEKSEWIHFLSVKSADEMNSWAKTILEAGNAVARQREQAVLGSNSNPPPSSSPNLSGPLISPEALSSPPIPPVPSLPPTAIPPTPAAAIAAAARNPSRPALPILQQRSQTLPLGVSPAAQQAGLTRNKTVVKPTAREWGALGNEGKHQWVKESERQAKEAKQPLVDLSR